MNRENSHETPEDLELMRVLDAYLAEVEVGRPPDLDRLIGEHPAIASRLQMCLTSLQRVEQAVGNLTTTGPAPTPVVAPVPESGCLGDYRILREVGRGGMGIVYEAEQISLRRRVALNVLPFAATLDPRHLQRFKNEAQAAAQLHHPHIVPVYAVGVERGVHYYAMQYIEGQSLDALVRELRHLAGDRGSSSSAAAAAGNGTGPDTLPRPECAPLTAPSTPRGALTTMSVDRNPNRFRAVAQLGVQAAEALEHAHQSGVVHRDIKPANLLVDGRGELWITDFGLARLQGDTGLTLTGDVVGTLRYMSPEQALGRNALIDHRVDIYALGVTLYELLTLEPVFPGRSREELLRQIGDDEPRPPRTLNPAIPVDLETIILKAMTKSPPDRYATAQELADDLQRFLEDQPIRARRPTPVEKLTRWARRHRPVVASAVALLVMALLALGVSTVLIAREQARTKAAHDAQAEQRARAEQNFRQARRAVDSFLLITEEELADRPELRDTRRRMLEVALAYYQEFIEQRSDDPTLRAELAASHLRVATILNEIGSQTEALAALERARQIQERLPAEPEFQRALAAIYSNLDRLRGGWLLQLLLQKSVQEDLKLSDEQVKQVKQIGERRTNTFRDFRPPNQEDIRRKVEELAAQEKAMMALLHPDQVRRLQQIVLQLQGTRAFSDIEVARALKLTDEQREKIRLVQEEARQAWFGFSGPFGGPETWKRPEDSGKSVREEVLKLLSAEQHGWWREMTGEPFKGELRATGPPWPQGSHRGSGGWRGP